MAFMLVFSCLHGYQMKNPTNRIDVSLGDAQSLTPALLAQAIFNVNEGFYVGLRYTSGCAVYYYSKATGSLGYKLDFSYASFMLGLQFGAFNERFNVFFNLMPGYAFGSRYTGGAPAGQDFLMSISPIAPGSEAVSFFTPAIEIGFNCQLTENLILSTGWQATAISVRDMAWVHYPWLIKTSEENALYFSIPLRLTWRF